MGNGPETPVSSNPAASLVDITWFPTDQPKQKEEGRVVEKRYAETVKSLWTEAASREGERQR